MEGDSTVFEVSGEAVAAPPEVAEGGSNSGDEDKGRDDEGDKNYGGNRWPRQETLALLKIRFDMDSVFRDSTLKGPLWDDVSRKLEELGYRRSAKKCKEKFENVYKYHKRTKEGRRGKKSDGKAYRFFNEIEALENLHPPQQCLPKPLPSLTILPPWTTVPSSHFHQSFPVPSPATVLPKPLNSNFPPSQSNLINNFSRNFSPENGNFLFLSSTSSSTASDEELRGRQKRKRKWKDFFRRMAEEVMAKQEGLQMKFLEALDKIEHQRIVREESWRIQEMARINKEHEILVQEISTATAKDAAIVSFLQKIMSAQPDQTQSKGTPLSLPPLLQPPPAPPAIPPPNLNIKRIENGGNLTPLSTSRWPKAEVQALISLRTGLDMKYQENIPKGPLWEDISMAMKKLGYNRSSKRCKEKWENINKYFKKVKESNRKRTEDSKTCPYFQQLDMLYREKKKMESSFIPQMVPLMVPPEQQWPLPQQKKLNSEIENGQHNQEGEKQQEEEEEEAQEEEEEEEEEEEVREEGAEGGSFRIVTNKSSSMNAIN